MAARESRVDVLYHQHKLREQRVNMVDNSMQYKLVHMLILQCLIEPDMNITCTKEMHSVIENILADGNIESQLHYLEASAWQDEVMDQEDSEEDFEVYPEKNRFEHILPGKHVSFIYLISSINTFTFTTGKRLQCEISL